MTYYELKIRARFTALVGDPIWPVVEKLVQEDWRDGDEFWFSGVVQHCIDLCERLGLPHGPAWCDDCGQQKAELGNADGTCQACQTKRAEEKLLAEAARLAYEALDPEEKAELARQNRMFIGGLIARDVQ